jgi:hypothetical protein
MQQAGKYRGCKHALSSGQIDGVLSLPLPNRAFRHVSRSL